MIRLLAVGAIWTSAMVGAINAQPHDSAFEVQLEATDKTTQFPGGVIIFPASDSKNDTEVGHINLATGEHNTRFPLVTKNIHQWDYKPTRWGMYDVKLTCAASGDNQPVIEVEVAGHSFVTVPKSIEGTNRFKTIPIGRFYLEKSEPFIAKVQYYGGARIGSFLIKSLTLRPAPEGGPIVQAENGAFSLPASNAITHSVLMRYEPAAIKNCMGYWMNPADWAEWIFDVKKPGTFEIEVWQGCGKGSGGSDVFVEAGGKQFPFVVEDTGHFQNFVPRRVGQVTFDKPGEQSLQIHVKRQQKGAIMDIREVKLLPVEKN